MKNYIDEKSTNDFKIVCVDFDCTLTKVDTYPFSEQPNIIAFKILKEYRKRGNKLILWTCRTNEPLENALQFCKENGLEFDAVNDNIKESSNAWRELHPGIDMSRKVYADMYIDDRDPHALVYGIDWESVCKLLLDCSIKDLT